VRLLGGARVCQVLLVILSIVLFWLHIGKQRDLIAKKHQ
jgi:hypothetical protein